MTTEDQQPDAGYENFDEVFGSAIDVAVRRAVDRIGREPMGDLGLGDGPIVVADEPDADAVPAPPAENEDDQDQEDHEVQETDEQEADEAPAGGSGSKTSSTTARSWRCRRAGWTA